MNLGKHIKLKNKIGVKDWAIITNSLGIKIVSVKDVFNPISIETSKRIIGQDLEKKKKKDQQLPDVLVTKLGQAKIAVDENRVQKNISAKGNVAYIVEDTEDNSFVVSHKQVGKQTIMTCSCSADGKCKSFHVEAAKYFTTGVLIGSTLVPKNNIRKKATVDRTKPKSVLGKKKPDKATFEKYRKLQANLQEKINILEDNEDADNDNENRDNDNVDKETSDKTNNLEENNPNCLTEQVMLNNTTIAQNDNEDEITEKNDQTRKKITKAIDQTNILFGKNECDVCKKTFIKPIGLKIHKSRCSAEAQEPVSCDVCHKEFKNKAGLKQHKTRWCN